MTWLASREAFLSFCRNTSSRCCATLHARMDAVASKSTRTHPRSLHVVQSKQCLQGYSCPDISSAHARRQEPQPEVEPESEHPAGADLRSYIQEGEGALDLSSSD